MSTWDDVTLEQTARIQADIKARARKIDGLDVRTKVGRKERHQMIAPRIKLTKPPKVKAPVATEAQVLHACLDLLAAHPKVAMAWRVNTGAMKVDDRFVRFGAKGTPDIAGILQGGRALFVEVKRRGKLPTADQNAFLASASLAGAWACWCDSVDRLDFLLKVV